jgi:hypothetical protein
MIVKFDPKLMHVQAVCGILEKYEPTDEVKSIYAKVEELKAQMVKFSNEVLNPGLEQIQRLVDAENKKFTPEPEQKPASK